MDQPIERVGEINGRNLAKLGRSRHSNLPSAADTRRRAHGQRLPWRGPALTAALDVLAHDLEPSRAPNHLPSRHDDGGATAELHEVDFLIGGTEQHEVRDPEVESPVPLVVSPTGVSPATSPVSLPPERWDSLEACRWRLVQPVLELSHRLPEIPHHLGEATGAED